ncbi:MAG: hypothetical protein KDD15_30555, partial [Lewinella sp.]|nr:hypothetical protein [Lewinella sp.]
EVGEVRIEGTQSLSDPNIQLYLIDGSPVQPTTIFHGKAFNCTYFQKGIYLFILRDGEQIVGSEIVVIKE